MDFTTFLLSSAQPGYASSIQVIADRWRHFGVVAALDGVDDPTLFPRTLDWVASQPDQDAQTLQILEDLSALSWWRGPEISDAVARQIGEVSAPIFDRIAAALRRDQLSRTTRETARRRHILMVGALLGPLHSPSRGAVDYAAALCLDPDIVEIRVCHSNDLEPGLQAYIRARLGPDLAAGRVQFVNIDRRPDFLTAILAHGGGAFHFWCERPMSPYVTLLSWLGPTLMFTCGDERPYQYADVYWYYHDRSRMMAHWAARGLPPALAANYVEMASGPFHAESPTAPRPRSSLDAPDDAVVIATVGNRLGVDMDAAYLNGMEQTLQASPHALWLVVGALPEGLRNACAQVLGRQFRHVPYETDLPALLGAADIFSNPFRRGGGASATFALGSGAILLTLDQGDVACLAPPDHRAASTDVYFRHLSALVGDPAHRRAWRETQQSYYATRIEQTAAMRGLMSLVDCAYDRYAARLDAALRGAA